jgi:hypothetical protein
VTFVYRSIHTGSSPEPYVLVLENSEVKVPRTPCGTSGPMGGKWAQNVENTKLRFVFFSDCIIFFLTEAATLNPCYIREQFR